MLALRLVLVRGPADARVRRGRRRHRRRPRPPRSAGRWPPSATDHQVLVVTHLPQVAAWADPRSASPSARSAARRVTEAPVLDGDDREVELARMLSGSPDSATARRHAAELLAAFDASRP